MREGARVSLHGIGGHAGLGTGRSRVAGNGNAKARDPRQHQIPIPTGKEIRLLRKSTNAASGIHVGSLAGGSISIILPSLVLFVVRTKVARGPE